jgi:hypothetical protein
MVMPACEVEKTSMFQQATFFTPASQGTVSTG